MFQFTHPGRGATGLETEVLKLRMVSIHAPREGCDAALAPPAIPAPRFQFTHPGRGATSLSGTIEVITISFNSRTPGGVRRTLSGTLKEEPSFNSRTPGGVRRQRGLQLDNLLKEFQFTHPGRGATSKPYPSISSRRVSIHAPREGCDHGG